MIAGVGLTARAVSRSPPATLAAAERAAEREDDEADAAEQERDADDDTEERHLLGHVADVQRGRERGRRDPGVAGRVGDRVALLVLQRGGLVTRAGRVLRVGSGDEAPHLRVGQAVGALECVLVHDLRERPRLGAGLNRLLGPLGRELGDCRVIGGAEDDLLLLEAVADRRAAVDAHGDRSGAEHHQHQPCDDAADHE